MPTTTVYRLKSDPAVGARFDLLVPQYGVPDFLGVARFSLGSVLITWALSNGDTPPAIVRRSQDQFTWEVVAALDRGYDSFVDDNLPDGDYFYQVGLGRQVIAVSGWLQSSAITVYNALAIPGNFAAANGVSGVNLSWTQGEPVDLVTGFEIQRSPANLNTWVTVITPNPVGTDRAATDTSAVPGTSYDYRMRALGDGGIFSDYCAKINITASSGATQPPTNFVATVASSSSINLTWNVSPTTGATTVIERSPNGSTGWTVITTQATGVSSYTDTGLAASTIYYYRAKAHTNSGGDSTYTSVTNATTSGSSPNPPTNPTATPGATDITVAWTASTTSGVETKVERSDDGTTGWAVLATVPNGTNSYDDTGLGSGITKYYRMRAHNVTSDAYSAYTSVVHTTTGSPPAWDAQFISQNVPSTAEADTVFSAQITFKNTGTQAWNAVALLGQSPKLISQSPAHNMNWGTDFIIEGQGQNVLPGQTFTFTSNLKAPSALGSTDFQWRPFVQYSINNYFGDFSTLTTINVTANTTPPYSPPPTPPVQDGRRALTAADLTYIGSFRPMAATNSADYSEIGIALRITAGTRTLILNQNFGSGSTAGVNEISIPTPAIWDGTRTGALALPASTQIRHWGAISNAASGATGSNLHGPVGGIYFDDATKLLWWTFYNAYWAGGNTLPILNCTQLNDDGTTAWVGSWTVPNQKYYWSGVTRVPTAFATKYTSGNTLGMGFGGEFSVVAPCSRGPAFCVFADPTPVAGIGAVASVTRLVDYTQTIEAAFRTGDYFLANLSYWNTQPTSIDRGSWCAGDDSRAGIMIYWNNIRGFIAFTELAKGRIGYDYAAGTIAALAQDMYVYDPDEMGAGAGGSGSHALTPYLRIRDFTPLQFTSKPSGTCPIRGVCADEANRLIYVCEAACYKSGTELSPLIHVFQVAP